MLLGARDTLSTHSNYTRGPLASVPGDGLLSAPPRLAQCLETVTRHGACRSDCSAKQSLALGPLLAAAVLPKGPLPDSHPPTHPGASSINESSPKEEICCSKNKIFVTSLH